jgi:hypothetical protein
VDEWIEEKNTETSLAPEEEIPPLDLGDLLCHSHTKGDKDSELSAGEGEAEIS